MTLNKKLNFTEQLHIMLDYVKYELTPVDSELEAVNITTDSMGPWVDDCENLTIRALMPDAIPIMQEYLKGLVSNTSWTARESKGTYWYKTGNLPDGKGQIELHSSSDSRREPKQWFSLFISYSKAEDTMDVSNLIEVTMLDHTLVEQMYDALIEGTLQIEFT